MDEYCRQQLGLPLVEDQSQDSGSWHQMSVQGNVKPGKFQNSISLQLEWIKQKPLEVQKNVMKSHELHLEREPLEAQGMNDRARPHKANSLMDQPLNKVKVYQSFEDQIGIEENKSESAQSLMPDSHENQAIDVQAQNENENEGLVI